MGRYAFRPRTWSVERIVAEIRALHAAGELGSTHELEAAGHKDLVAAANRYIGTWERAIRLAGVAYQQRRRAWTRDSVTREIRKIHRAGKSLAATQIETSLVLAARRRFGSWTKARAAAVPGYGAPYVAWTKPKLRAAISKLYAGHGSLVTGSVRAAGHAKLVSAAVRLFGSWREACKRAVRGYTSSQREDWTSKSVLRAIRARHRDGESVNARIVSEEDPGLVNAARAWFGGWPAARRAAGVSFKDPRKVWTKQRVIEELRRRAAGRRRLTLAEAGGTLSAAAWKYFGTYARAWRAAGLGSGRKLREDAVSR